MTDTPDPLVINLFDIDQRIEDWRAIPQTPEQAAPDEAVAKATERLTNPPFRFGGPDPLIISSPENEADADRELDQSFEYGPEVPRGDKNSTQLLVWRVHIGDKVARVGEMMDAASLYLAAVTKAESLAMAARIIRHPETPYPASWTTHGARELVDVPAVQSAAVQDEELIQDDLVPEVVEDEEDPGPL